MAWITPGGSSEQIAQTFRDFEPYPFVLTQVQTVASNKPDAGDQFLFTFALEGRPEITVRCYAGKSLGEYQGRVAKLRAILNAMFGRVETAAVEGIDDETYQVKYPDEQSLRSIQPGLRLVARGRFFPRQDGSQAYKLEAFQAASTFAQPPAAFPQAQAQPPSQPAPAAPSAAAPVSQPLPLPAAPAGYLAPATAVPVQHPSSAAQVPGYPQPQPVPAGAAPGDFVMPVAPGAPAPSYANGAPITSQPPF